MRKIRNNIKNSQHILVGIATNGVGGVDSYILSFVRVAYAAGVFCDVVTTNYSPEFALRLAEFNAKLLPVSNLHNKKTLAADMKDICAGKELRGKEVDGCNFSCKSRGPYSAAYMNISTAIMYPYIKACYDAGIKKIVAHAHAHYNSQPNFLLTKLFDYAHYYYRRKLNKLPITIAGCSRDSAEWIGGSGRIISGDWVFVPNPIDVEACAYDSAKRELKISELSAELEVDLSSKTIIGTATAFMPYKNPLFLIDVFAEYAKIDASAYLLVAADGPMKNDVIAYAKDILPPDMYKLLGHRTDVPELLQAFDAFVLTSKNEGLGMCLLEAQAASLPCIMGTSIPNEATAISQLVHKVPLGNGAKTWAETIETAIYSASERNAKDAITVSEAGFNLNSPAKILPYLLS